MPVTVLPSCKTIPLISLNAWKRASKAAVELLASLWSVKGTKKPSDARTALLDAESRLSGDLNIVIPHELIPAKFSAAHNHPPANLETKYPHPVQANESRMVKSQSDSTVPQSLLPAVD